MIVECSESFSHVLFWSLQEDDKSRRRRTRRGKYGEPVGLTQKRTKTRKKGKRQGRGKKA